MPVDLHAMLPWLASTLVALAEMPLLVAWLGSLLLLPPVFIACKRAELPTDPAAGRAAAVLLTLALLVKAGRFVLEVSAVMPHFVWRLGLVLCLLGLRRRSAADPAVRGAGARLRSGMRHAAAALAGRHAGFRRRAVPAWPAD